MGNKKEIRIAYSPDADDLFMFYALINHKVDSKQYTFHFQKNSTDLLNNSAQNSDYFDVLAISVHVYPYIADRYLILPHGGSIGNNYGPVLITKTPTSLESLEGKKIAVPGNKTTAYLLLKMILPKFQEIIIPVSPFEGIFSALAKNKVDAGLLIHEGRMIYKKRGFHKVIDVGQWWYQKKKLPLPLGANVIRRALGKSVINAVSQILKASIQYALSHKDEVIYYILKNDSRKVNDLDSYSLISKYLSLYANHNTYDYGEKGRTSIQTILNCGYEEGLIPYQTNVQFSS